MLRRINKQRSVDGGFADTIMTRPDKQGGLLAIGLDSAPPDFYFARRHVVVSASCGVQPRSRQRQTRRPPGSAAERPLRGTAGYWLPVPFLDNINTPGLHPPASWKDSAVPT